MKGYQLPTNNIMMLPPLLRKGIYSWLATLFLAFLSTSCGSSSDLEKSTAINLMKEHTERTNEAKLRELRSKIMESGGRSTDEAMMDELLDVLILFSVTEHANTQLDSDELSKTINSLDSISRLDSWYYAEKIQGQMDVINDLLEIYIQSRDTIDLALLAGSLQVLKSSFIEDLFIRIQLPYLEPLKVNFYIDKDSITVNKSLSVIATLEKPLDENLLSIANEDVEILLNKKSIDDVKLIEIGSGGWIIVFRPTQTGKYIIHFEGNISLLSNQTNVLMPFVGLHEIQVN